MKGKRKLKDEVIGARRFKLFIRDQLKNDAETVFRSIFAPSITKDKRQARNDLFDYICEVISKKWNCSLIPIWYDENVEAIATGKVNFINYINWNEMRVLDAPLSESPVCFLFSSETSTVKDYGKQIERLLNNFKRKIGNPLSREAKEFKSKGWIFKYLDGGYDDKGNIYIPFASDRIVLGIDIGGLTDKDKNIITEKIWNVIKSKIKERKTKGQKHIPAVRDPKELGFITSSKIEDKDFEKYLKWYELHMGGDYITPKGLPFRTIASHEFLEKECPDKAEEGKRKIAEKTKTIKSRSGREKTIKGVVGELVKGEDNVEKRVKQIYQAIHRKPYPSKKKVKLWNCPEHGEKCPEGCKYSQAKMEEFNRRNMLFKPLVTTEKELSAIDSGEEIQEADERIDAFFKNKKKELK